MGALNRSLRVVQAAPASHFDRSAGCLREIHSERLTGHCFLHPRAKRGGSCPTTDPEITEKLLRCRTIVQLICGDAENLPLPSDSVDGIFMSFTLELFDTPDIPTVLRECMRVLKVGGRLAIVGLSKETQGGLVRAFEWTHRHFPNLVNCRPIFVRRALEEAGYLVHETLRKRMWVPVEIVLAQPAG